MGEPPRPPSFKKEAPGSPKSVEKGDFTREGKKHNQVGENLRRKYLSLGGKNRPRGLVVTRGKMATVFERKEGGPRAGRIYGAR